MEPLPIATKIGLSISPISGVKPLKVKVEGYLQYYEDGLWKPLDLEDVWLYIDGSEIASQRTQYGYFVWYYTFTESGSHNIIVAYKGSAVYNPCSSGSITVTITEAEPQYVSYWILAPIGLILAIGLIWLLKKR